MIKVIMSKTVFAAGSLCIPVAIYNISLPANLNLCTSYLSSYVYHFIESLQPNNYSKVQNQSYLCVLMDYSIDTKGPSVGKANSVLIVIEYCFSNFYIHMHLSNN